MKVEKTKKIIELKAPSVFRQPRPEPQSEWLDYINAAIRVAEEALDEDEKSK